MAEGSEATACYQVPGLCRQPGRAGGEFTGQHIMARPLSYAVCHDIQTYLIIEKDYCQNPVILSYLMTS